MREGHLNQYFRAVAVKRLSPVEVDAAASNQHEYNGVSLLKKMLGTSEPKKVFATHFLYVTDEDDPIESDGELTWYDARYRHPTRTEWRLYYPSNEATGSSLVGDSMFLCLKQDGTMLEIIARRDSIIENQLFWLFGIRPEEESGRFVAKTDMQEQPSDRVAFTARMVLHSIGVNVDDEREEYTDILVERFGGEFPSTREFSEFARSMVDADPIADPDGALLSWFGREEQMFRCMERHLIQERLKRGFATSDGVDVDSFIQFSLSVNNRRKSRAGLSLENHLEALFDAHGIRYSHTPVTENKSRPDFIFPSIEQYRDEEYPAAWLAMLGAKTTAKDRWRQVLEEADRIERKHLITLEGAISENQTNEMRSRKLQLVVPREIQATFTSRQQEWLYSVGDFLREVRERQAFADQYLHIGS